MPHQEALLHNVQNPMANNSPHKELKIITINTNGLCRCRIKLEQYIIQKQVDIACLQETHKLDHHNFKEWTKNMGYDSYVNAPQHTDKAREYTGVAIPVKESHLWTVSEHKIIQKNRAHSITLSVNERKIKIVNLYAPSGKRDYNQRVREEFYQNLNIEIGNTYKET